MLRSWGAYQEMTGAATSVLFELATTRDLRGAIGFPKSTSEDAQEGGRRGLGATQLMYEGPYAVY